MLGTTKGRVKPGSVARVAACGDQAAASKWKGGFPMNWLSVLLVAGLAAGGFHTGVRMPNSGALDPLLVAGMGLIIGCLIVVGLNAEPG